MGIMVIKTIRPREKVKDLLPEDLIRYALSLEHVHAAVVGTDSVDVVRKNAELLKNFRPMSPEEMQKMTACLDPLFKGHDLPWMHPGYDDGGLA
jgi:hypothetical protein